MATITTPRSTPPARLNGALNEPDLEFGRDQHAPTPEGWGNAGPLSLLAFAVVTLMLSLINAKAITADVAPVVFGVGLIFGGTTQLIGGLIQLRNGNTFQGVLFSCFGAFWIALAAILDKAGIKGLAANFLRVITTNRRLFALRDMIRAYRVLAARHKGEVTAEVTVAEPLSDKNLDALKDALKSVTGGKDIDFDVKVEPAIIGGLIVKVGSRMIDSSLRTKLNAIKIAMKEAR